MQRSVTDSVTNAVTDSVTNSNVEYRVKEYRV